jgi:hypothetical protein
MGRKQKWTTDEDPVSEDDVRSVGAELGCIFPETYIALASKFNGGYPRNNIFDAEGRPECVFSYLLGYPDELPEFFKAIRDRLPKYIVPFGYDPFGNAICFDFRVAGEPKVVFWDHETKRSDAKKLHSVADSFESFLQLLHEDLPAWKR